MTSRDRLVKITATFLGVGYAGRAPGTAGSFAGLALAWWSGPYSPAVLLVFLALGFLVCKPAARVFSSNDPRCFVMDEVCGMMIAVFLLPPKFFLYLAGFILFRLLDIFKPWPISVIQRSPHPWAIMGDDLLAGVMANLLLHGYLLLR